MQNSQQLSRSGNVSPTDSESVFTDDEEWLAANPNDSVNGGMVIDYYYYFTKLSHKMFLLLQTGARGHPKAQWKMIKLYSLTHNVSQNYPMMKLAQEKPNLIPNAPIQYPVSA